MKKKLLVVGCGTLSNAAAIALSYSGFDDLTFVDMDTIETYNLPRSPLFRSEDVGQSKALTMAKRVAEYSPFPITVTGIHADITRLGFAFLEGFDMVMSPVDSWSIRAYVSMGCHLMGVTHLTCGTALLQGRMMGSTIVTEEAGAEACYECMVKGNLNDQEQKLSCLGYKPETQPQVESFSMAAAGMMCQSAVTIALGRYHGCTCNDSPHTWMYVQREYGMADDARSAPIIATRRSRPDPGCSFHRMISEVENKCPDLIELHANFSTGDMYRALCEAFGKEEGAFSLDFRASRLYYIAFPEGKQGEERTPPYPSLEIDDRSTTEEDRFVFDRMPPDHVYLVEDVSDFEGRSRLVRIRRA